MNRRKEARIIGKGVIIILVLAAGLMFASAVYAYFPAGIQRTSQPERVDLDSLKKFQRETLSLRDALITKRLELSREFCKKKLNKNRIAELQRKILDIRAQIQEKADEAGIAGQYAGRTGCDWMSRKGII
jgi:hypothetical protein